ncbi:hypothetical protein [Desulfohalovibrio reitneri]|uniref:hypothetical protein n=1 Tax=Desulfohalovibrio reitneri TaxID=1307759 RepID=UPI0004A784A2|nr:hypothetical protein [Desulfohalovibrio reitneri]
MEAQVVDSHPGATLLNKKHLQALQDIYKFSGIRRYHGMLPEKHALLYDPGLLDYLEENSLIEEGTVIARCGSQLRGYRLTDTARRDLRKMGLDLTEEGQIEEIPTDQDFGELTKEQINIIRDIYHFIQIKKFNGIAPKHEVEEYDKRDMKILYDLGYILYIKLKGKAVRYTKGYILTDQAIRLLRAQGHILT